MKFVNLTPHALTIHREGDQTPLVLPPSGQVARVSVERVRCGELEGVPVFSNTYGDVTGLPPETLGEVYVVSAIVAGRVAHRTDVASPGELVRDAVGRVIGCLGLTVQ